MISSLLRTKGWIVPNYPLPQSTDGSDKWEVLRVVFRSEMSMDLVQLLLTHIHLTVQKLIKCSNSIPEGLSVGERRYAIYNMMLILASPESTVDDEASHHKRKNYRGTC
ncbi:LADA_0D02762g1_1 [Lachancea dasiensis]|uniref:LADA_0D02762g1_1 n=1 Tax=Lachancea dasiensis TaxID=1072105 RepID=A0A1G4J4C8_9SACH|nr:LADA_0D02762g1_1 [Lachancea dasiensis]